ncbi:MAG TPA: hypothetical protein VK927_02840 [Adhaeribacter sp.]|nr:hypothetical protein [Adhaeribacter sp.]
MLLCFLVASTFWVLNSLNKNYNGVRVSYPLVFVYDKTKLIAVTEPPREVVVNVTGKGWKLLRKALNLRIRPARIDITSRFRRNYLTARELRPHINAALNGLVLNYVVTDTVYFNFEPILKRQILLAVDTSRVLVAENHVLTGMPRITPAVVTVSGPESLVKMLPSPFPVHVPDSNLTQNYSKQVPLSFVPENLITPNVAEATIVVNVTALQQFTANVPVSLANRTSQNERLLPVPAMVKVSYMALPAAQRIDTTAFRVEADLNQISAQDSTVQLQITSQPTQVRNVSVSPGRIKIAFPAPAPDA